MQVIAGMIIRLYQHLVQIFTQSTHIKYTEQFHKCLPGEPCYIISIGTKLGSNNVQGLKGKYTGSCVFTIFQAVEKYSFEPLTGAPHAILKSILALKNDQKACQEVHGDPYCRASRFEPMRPQSVLPANLPPFQDRKLLQEHRWILQIITKFVYCINVVLV